MRRAIRFPGVVESHGMRIYETFTLHFERAAREVARLDGTPPRFRVRLAVLLGSLDGRGHQRAAAAGDVSGPGAPLRRAGRAAVRSVGMELLNACQSVTSVRLSSQLGALQVEFVQHRQVPEVRELAHDRHDAAP